MFTDAARDALVMPRRSIAPACNEGCNPYAISMQSVCNQHVIIWHTFGRVVPPSEADDDVAEKG